MGVRVRTAITPHGWWGAYDHKRRLITLRPGLGPIQLKCTLMHELGHANYGHVGISGKQELLANRWAAYRLINFEDIVRLASQEQSSSAVAANLEVMPDVLETYLKLLNRAQLGELRQASLERVA